MFGNFYNELTNYNTSGLLSIWSLIIIVISITLLSIVFGKAGEKWWKALIPFYNLYTLFKISWKTSKFWLLVACLIIMVLPIIMKTNNFNDTIQGIIVIIWIISFAIAFIINVELVFKISSSFNKGVLFTIGLLLIPIIFLGILAFDDSEYKKIV